MKLYFAKKPNHININGIYYPKQMLKDAVDILNKKYKDRAAPFILHAKNPVIHHSLPNMIGSLGLLYFDEEKQMYFSEVLVLTDSYKSIISGIGEENFLVDCVSYCDITPNGNKVTKISFDNRFWLIDKSETNL